MRLLALDATTAACSVAIWADGAIRAERHREGERGHAAVLVTMAEEAMAAAGLAFRDLDAVAAGIGPGSFTGIRVALAAAVGFAAAHGLAGAGVTSFAALARAVRDERGDESGHEERPVLAAVDTKRGDVYALALHPSGRPLAGWPAEGLVMSPEALAAVELPLPPDLDLAGDVQDRLVEVLAARGISARRTRARHPTAAAVARVAAASIAAGNILPLRPRYLRPPDAIPARR